MNNNTNNTSVKRGYRKVHKQVQKAQNDQRVGHKVYV